MGTRSLTTVYDYDGTPILTMYRQHDGYFGGHGQELAAFLSPLKLVNGIGSETTDVANGPGCLAAQLVSHFKNGVGGIYLQPSDGSAEEEYNYEVRCDPSSDPWAGGTIRMVARGHNKVMWEGEPSAYDAADLNRREYPEDYEEEDEAYEDRLESTRESALSKLTQEEREALGW